MKKTIHIWETHGIHVGTMGGPVKHGVDDLNQMIDQAIQIGHPSITFIIHTPRLTQYRYPAELKTDIRFIRGDTAYFEYTTLINSLKEKYRKKIEIRFGVELEWQGSGLGLQWSKSKLLQVPGVDFIIGSVHFSKEYIPYDDSKKETDSLIEKRVGLENLWDGYLNEVIEMIQSIGDKIHVVGHLDLPKLYADIPDELLNFENSNTNLSRKLTTLLEMIRDLNLALDLNLAGMAKGCGVYPNNSILKKAHSLGIPIAIGTDAHDIDHLGAYYEEGIAYAKDAGYKSYVSFNKCIPEIRPLCLKKDSNKFIFLNRTINILNQRHDNSRREMPNLSFGGDFKELNSILESNDSLGNWSALRARRGKRSITLTPTLEKRVENLHNTIYFRHTDTPGTLSLFFSILASEGINIETAFLSQRNDNTGEAFLTVSDQDLKIQKAIDFAKGTAPHLFIEIRLEKKSTFPIPTSELGYIHDIDGVSLPIPLSNKMIFSIHSNTPGVLLTMLSGLASVGVNITDLRLGKRGDLGYAALGIKGKRHLIDDVIEKLGNEFSEVSIINVT